ncbi:MAG: type II toxin-antitoxin system Phd/YefM family antitoxin [Bryobacterales bacterium]|nr:type II toxin-antitoxin system Phd/YefM family antitoxin [Bryobacterales bacterium]
MPEIVNIHSAKTHLSQLLGRVMQGEEIVIAKAGKPVARLIPERAPAAAKRVPGIDKDKLWIADDFDSMSERDLAAWHGSRQPKSKRPRK